MSANHTGNLLNQITFEEHEPTLNAKRVVLASNTTIFAVVNTSAAGQASVRVDGNVTLSDSKGFIGLSTVVIGSGATLFAVVNTAAAGQASVKIDGNVTLSDAKTFIGLTTTTLGASPAFVGIVTVANNSLPVTFSGNVTLDPGSVTSLGAGVAGIGFATVNVVNLARTITGNVTLSDPKTYIGLTTTTLGESLANIGFATVTMKTSGTDVVLGPGAPFSSFISTPTGNPIIVTLRNVAGLPLSIRADNTDGTGISATSDKIAVLSRGTVFNGSTWDRMAGNATGSFVYNVGTTKTLIPLPVAFAQASIVTIAVPTGGGALFKITNLVLNSNATTRINIKSGATYLTGNVSLGLNIFPGGGMVQVGSPDSPSYIGLASGAAIVVEKFDTGGIVSQIGGHLIYFQE